ncbi:MAG: hypothetical protein Q9167_007370 [Letrouitia subvulpina]
MPSSKLDADLPDSSSSCLALVEATRAEKLITQKLNATAWRGPLDEQAYIRREQHLWAQDLTRNGRITFWILIDASSPPLNGIRMILANCESIRKRALISKGDGMVEEVVTHGIGSVYCDPRFRGRGYASRMMIELSKKLDTWGQKDGNTVDFTVLWSDIGKDFYARLGWECFPSTHVSLRPIKEEAEDNSLPRVSLLHSRDLAELCQQDEALLRASMTKNEKELSCLLIALVPDVETMQWHHAREEFLAKELLQRSPDVKGALTKCKNGSRVWSIWTRTFGHDKAGNILNILRIVVENEALFGRQSVDASNLSMVESNQDTVFAIASVLQAAQLEAVRWNMAAVNFWNPSPLSVLAAKVIEPAVTITIRDEDSISSLSRHGNKLQRDETIEWVMNEKYGWC